LWGAPHEHVHTDICRVHALWIDNRFRITVVGNWKMEQGWRSVDYLYFGSVCLECAKISCWIGGWNHLQDANEIKKRKGNRKRKRKGKGKGKLGSESRIGYKTLDLLLGSILIIDKGKTT
jgi:hypothetical protein